MTLHANIFACACCQEPTQGSGLIDPDISLDFPVCPDCHKKLRLANAQLYAASIHPCDKASRLRGYLKD